MTVRLAKKYTLAAAIAGLLGSAGLGGAHAVEVTIIEPGTPLMVKNQSVPWKCSVQGEGDQPVMVTWTWYDGTGDVQEGAKLFEVEHVVANAGEFLVQCQVYDPESEDLDIDQQTFRVLWVELSGNTGEVHPDNQAAPHFYSWSTPDSTNLGFKRGIMAYHWTIEIVGSCTPHDWRDVAPEIEGDIVLVRHFGPLGGKHWGGQDGDQETTPEGKGAPGTDDTSEPEWRDDDATSATEWPDNENSPEEWRGLTFDSVGTVYDIDIPSPGLADPEEIVRIRANFVQWAGYGIRCSDEKAWSVAFSCDRNGDFVTDFGARGDNSLNWGSHLSSVDWDLEE